MAQEEKEAEIRTKTNIFGQPLEDEAGEPIKTITETSDSSDESEESEESEESNEDQESSEDDSLL